MTVDEFKAELEALVAKIDESLAAELTRSRKPHALECRRAFRTQDRIVPDRATRPEVGHVVWADVSVYFESARITYEGEAANAG